MTSQERQQTYAVHADQFNRHEGRDDGLQIAGNLATGLRVVRDLFYTRIHADVERVFGRDSMLVPVSEVKSMMQTKREIDTYQVVESAADAGLNKYVSGVDDWFMKWLAGLRLAESAALPEVEKRIAAYKAQETEKRRLAFATVLERTMPEASKAPLIMYQLLPPAVSIVTALAFDDSARAQQLRKKQMGILPVISDCRQCRGGVLEPGMQCPQCGSPFWKYEWLTAV